MLSRMLLLLGGLVASGVALAKDISECFPPDTLWLSVSDSAYSSGALAVPGWTALRLLKSPKEWGDDCEFASASYFLRIVYGHEDNTVLAGCRGDFNGDSSGDYALLMQAIGDSVLPFVFMNTGSGYQSIALDQISDRYGFDEDRTVTPGPFCLKRPSNGIFEWDTEWGPHRFQSVGDLVMVGWSTYAWTDSGFVVVHSAD